MIVSAEPLEYPVRHKRLAVDCGGRLRFEPERIVYEGLCGKGRRQRPIEWTYEDAQRLELYEKRVVLRGYQDRKWLAGSDEVFDFRLEGPVDTRALYAHLRDRMDSRLVARIAYGEGTPLWRVPAKSPAKFEGAQGELLLYAWGLVFASAKSGASRTWRDSDLLLVSSAGPRAFGVVTPEREFVFQLKRELKAEQYDVIWFRLNRPRGLQLISRSQGETQP